jgi:hypothetical protein
MKTKFSAAEQEIVKALIDTKAINFEAIGAAVAKHGASATLTLDGEDVFCGTMRRFTKVYRIRDEANPIEQLAELRQIAGELKGQ